MLGHKTHPTSGKCYNNTKEPIMKLPRCQRGERTRVSSATSNVTMEAIISLCKRRGFIYQGSDVYGGLSGTWDYGPLGVALKRNIMNLWWRRFVDERDDMYGVDAAILMNQKVSITAAIAPIIFSRTMALTRMA